MTTERGRRDSTCGALAGLGRGKEDLGDGHHGGLLQRPREARASHSESTEQGAAQGRRLRRRRFAAGYSSGRNSAIARGRPLGDLDGETPRLETNPMAALTWSCGPQQQK